MNKTLTIALAIAFSSCVSANESTLSDANLATQAQVIQAKAAITDNKVTLATVDNNDTAAIEASFLSTDSNQDGFISLNEVTDNEALAIAFSKLDVDLDGALSLAEYKKFSS